MKGRPQRGKNRKQPFPLSKKVRVPEDYIKVSTRPNNLKDVVIVKYPWKDWTDGSWWSITRYSDYKIETLQMVRSLQVRGWRTGYRVHTIRVDEYTIWFKFYTGKRVRIHRAQLGLKIKPMKKGGFSNSRNIPGIIVRRKLNK